jgi:flagellar protein FliO/FliZ
MDSFALQLFTTLAALALVLALAWFSLRAMRNRLPGAGTNGNDGALRFLRALPVGPRERVVLVEHRGEQLMLGVTAGGISLLGRWPSAHVADEAAAEEAC